MMTLNSNKQKLKYALLGDRVPVYETDAYGNIVYYTDTEGNQIPLETGEFETGYTKPVIFYANISMSSGEAQPQEYGIDTSAYDAVLVLNKDEIPITETSLIWYTSKVGYKDSAETIVDGDTADFKVLAIKPSLNQLKVLLGAITK